MEQELESGVSGEAGGSEGLSGGGDFDLGSAVESLGESLFGGEKSEAPVEKAPAAAPAPTPAPTPAVAPAPAPAPDSTTPGKPSLLKPDGTPKTWRNEASAAYATLPDVVKAEVLKREQEMFDGLEAQKPAASFGNAVAKVLQPYDSILRQHNINPVEQITNLMNSHYTLAFGTPEQKTALMQSIIRDYGIDMGALAPAQTDDFIDPQVKALREENAGLKSRLDRFEQNLQKRDADTVAAQSRSEIEAFSKRADVPHFQEVYKDMARLLQGGVCDTLESAYKQACLLHPAIGPQIHAEAAAAKAEAERKEAAERVAKAKRATSASVRSEGHSGSAAATLGTMDDTLNDTLAAIRRRH